ncbi:MAG: glycerol-3-phosphate dehydrogenase/oxidase, partial [Bacteroidota bacterium]|nr:glycerol-3-phosphate dehydrogenase/oxidase [Bacteroidota bacterium]
SKSTKLAHGGVRYLAQGNISLVREAVVERGLLSKNAPHLVGNLGFIIPVYDRWSRIKYTLGLKFYDWLSGKLSLGPSTFISGKEVKSRLPGIVSKKLYGGVLYHDGQFDDARLAVNLAETIFENGGYAINYFRVTELLKEGSMVTGVEAMDLETQKSYSIQARAVINATGVFSDSIMKLDDPDARKQISASRGVHLVIDQSFLPGKEALMIPKTPDGRVLFIVPWHQKLLLGTTDTPVRNISLEPVASQEEISFILQTAGGYLSRPPRRKDVLSVFAGLRPLASGEGEGRETKEISRGHKILVSPSGLFSMVGGKWTTFRKMGEDMIDRVEKESKWSHKNSVTANLPIHGFQQHTDPNDPLNFYGADTQVVNKLIEETSGKMISKKLNLYAAQVIWAVRSEMARTVEDVLSRRTRCLILDAEESVRIAPDVASVMAGEMKQSQQWQLNQVEQFRDIAENYILKV